MKISYSVEIDAPPPQVFYWLNDADGVLQWVPNLVQNQYLEVTPDRVGSTFRQVYLQNGRDIELQGVITAYEPNRRLAMEVKGGMRELTVDYELEDLGGRTRLSQQSDVRFRGLYKLFGLLAGGMIQKHSQQRLEDSLAKLKELAESGSS